MSKRPTINDIARLSGVSSGAVSYALNGLPGVSKETRQRILAVAEEIGWRPNISARALTVSRAHAVGWVIARATPTLGVEPFFMQFIAGLEAELSATGVGLLLQVVDDHRAAIEAIRRWWAERRVDGIIVTDIWTDDTRLPVLNQLKIPAVLVGRPQASTTLPAVWSDEANAVEAMVDYLVALGHQRIARVAGLPMLEHTQVRSDAFLAAMSRHGLTDPEVLITDYSRDQAGRATRRLLAGPNRPTAITYDNDVMAVAALAVAREMGIQVPDELSIVSGEDSELCVLVNPTITSLSRDISGYGALAARTLIDLIEHDGDTELESRQDTTSHLEPRGSTAVPPVPKASRSRLRVSGGTHGTLS